VLGCCITCSLSAQDNASANCVLTDCALLASLLAWYFLGSQPTCWPAASAESAKHSLAPALTSHHCIAL